MEKTEKVPFIEMLETSFDSQLSDAECEAFNVAYEEYIDMFYGLTAQSRKSFLDLLHEFARLRLRLMRLQERIVEKKSLQASLLKSALLLTNFEIRLVSVRLRYPSIAGPISGKVPKYPLYFSKEFTPNDVMELIAALHTAGVGRPYRRYPCQRGTVGRAVLVDVQCPYQQSHPVPPWGHQPQVAADTVSGSAAQLSD